MIQNICKALIYHVFLSQWPQRGQTKSNITSRIRIDYSRNVHEENITKIYKNKIKHILEHVTKKHIMLEHVVFQQYNIGPKHIVVSRAPYRASSRTLE